MRLCYLDDQRGTMLTIWTTTWSRPDCVQLLASALKATASVPYRFIVVVQPGGLRRQWVDVHDVIDGKRQDAMSWIDTVRLSDDGDQMHLHDDCIPMRAWTLPHLPCARNVGSNIIGSTLIAWHGKWRPFQATLPAPRATADTMPGWWPDDVRSLAQQCQSEVLLGGDFLHIDKSTYHHPRSAYNVHKRALMEAVARHLGIDAPEPLTDEELQFQRGIIADVAVTLKNEDGSIDGKPVVSRASRPGLGDMIASGLSAVGITKARAQAVANAVGIKDCGCGKRQAAANRLGTYLGLPPGSTAGS